MKTIAITVDDDTLALLEQLRSSTQERRSRSALIRAAIKVFAEFQRQRLEEERERNILKQNRKLLERQLVALVDDQASQDG